MKRQLGFAVEAIFANVQPVGIAAASVHSAKQHHNES